MRAELRFDLGLDYNDNCACQASLLELLNDSWTFCVFRKLDIMFYKDIIKSSVSLGLMTVLINTNESHVCSRNLLRTKNDRIKYLNQQI